MVAIHSAAKCRASKIGHGMLSTKQQPEYFEGATSVCLKIGYFQSLSTSDSSSWCSPVNLRFMGYDPSSETALKTYWPGLEHFLFFHSVGNFIIPTDELIFVRSRSTTNQWPLILPGADVVFSMSSFIPNGTASQLGDSTGSWRFFALEKPFEVHQKDGPDRDDVIPQWCLCKEGWFAFSPSEKGTSAHVLGTCFSCFLSSQCFFLFLLSFGTQTWQLTLHENPL